MREIKFRGKRIDNGEWIYGSLLDGDIIVSGPVDADGEYIGLGEWSSVDPKSVGQYTGLKDKNGQEICGGDILHWNIGFDMYSAVEYQDGSFWSGETLLADSLEEVVVGNIYDNADLIAEV